MRKQKPKQKIKTSTTYDEENKWKKEQEIKLNFQDKKDGDTKTMDEKQLK